MQDTAYQDNVIDAVVLVLLSMAGPDHSSSVKTARGSQPTSVSTAAAPDSIKGCPDRR